MIIDQYWGKYFGDSADSQRLAQYLAGKNREVLTTSEIFQDFQLAQLSGNYTQASLDGAGWHFDSAFQFVIDLAVLVLESKKVGRFSIARIGGPEDRFMRIDAATDELLPITMALKHYALVPEDYLFSHGIDEDDWYELGNLCEEIRAQLDA
ncbi:imm68 putative immunity domain-containing protein [Corynebacterium diphtheriae]|uniref:imm68 putative immunity domain-containing protein n=1 Tax=Corynebacterium diphtheriae TaxID=1717 RepID=UPI0013CBF596|nr:imm68 putative immunity domain-containing protein [Corynebacterium diphtheriae]MBG9292308.1 hypothetical protein [Corynebacterium diphtheriae bv. gravis]MBG9373162.1 hypothetical protein [Corynebacterium diphtheriae bv. gravis]CAB0683831.1 hypothetical protein FRC0022_00617 [Corynebacterium diphtheriae]CAB0892736.1 hypothetical protein FRC0418_00441 [Corynebacterium diphtheriae]CAB0896686.1 hypothetical protein FRC0429_00665 [Corynebacterium diphtheriae]